MGAVDPKGLDTAFIETEKGDPNAEGELLHISAVWVANCGGEKVRNPTLPFPDKIQNSLRKQSDKKWS